MTGREQDRPSRRGVPPGGTPSRRTGRPRGGERQAPPNRPAETEDEFDDVPARRAPRRPARRVSFAGSLAPVLGRLSTRRAALVALVVCALALSIAVPLQTYLSQRDELQAQLRQQQALRAQESKLEQRQQQLSDPAQIEAEARTRLHYVMPGETPYVVQLPNIDTPAPGHAAGPGTGPTASWYQTLWDSIVGRP